MEAELNLELYGYVHQAILSGVSETKIREKLLGAGYNEADIKMSIDTARAAIAKKQDPNSQKSYATWIRHYFNTSKKSIASLISIDMGLIFLSLLEPWPLKVMADSVFGNVPAPGPLESLTGTFDLLIVIATISVGLFVLSSAARLIDGLIATRLIYKFDVKIKAEVFNHILRLPFYHKERLHKGDYINRLRTLTNDVGALVLDSTSSIAESLLTIFGVLIVLIFINIKLTLIGLTVVPLLYLSIRYFAPKIQAMTEKKQGIIGEIANHIQESVENAETIQAFTDETNQVKKLLTQMKEKLRIDIASLYLSNKFNFTNSLFVVLGSTSIMLIGGREILNGSLSFGELFIFINYMNRLYGPVEGLTRAVADIKRRSVSAHRVYDILNDHQELEDVMKGYNIVDAKGRVRFENVTLKFDDKVVLDRINLDIPPGQKVGFIGPSGGGKSSLLKMVSMFLPPSSGKIYIDDYDLAQSSLDSIRKNVSIIGQSPQLFSGSILDNIMLGSQSRLLEKGELEEALVASNTHEFIEQMPAGVKTYVGEAGSMLSGGQKQRIAIARGLLKRSKILVMDEPTSALDTASENFIKEQLRVITKDSTVLMITHKLSMLTAMDKVYVVDGGTVRDVNDYGGLEKYIHYLQSHELE